MRLVLFVVLHFSFFISYANDPCDDLNVSVQIDENEIFDDLFDIQIVIKNMEKRKFEFYFYKNDYTNLLTDKIENSSISNVSSGDYICIINVDDKCFKEVKFKVL